MIIQNASHVISCDWGTSSFRLRLIETASVKCIAETISDKGNAKLFREWKEQKHVDRQHYYLQYLKESVDALSASSGMSLDGLCILISGMASSSVGMKELPYADLPFSLDGHSAYYEWINGEPVMSNPILLISGVQDTADVMRGEEIQLAGVISLADPDSEEEMLYIFPGTHSKHITVYNNRITAFSTFMTGEVFDVLAKHTILSQGVSVPGADVYSSEMMEAFQTGVVKSFQTGMLNNLFSVRINQLKNNISSIENYFYLSGLLIGAEIDYLRKQANEHQIVLCSNGTLQRLYHTALECASLGEHTNVVNAKLLDNAAAAGQLKIFMNAALKTI
jgi:2-dehydro-3-deoxygalactonokinase